MLSGIPLEALKRRAVVPDKLGTIDEVAAERILKEYDCAAPKMVAVVGTLDVEEAHKLKQSIESDAYARAELEKKYGIEPQKITILVLSMRLQYFYVAGNPLGIEYQIEYYRNIFADIRKVFSPNEANFIFKMHPKEENIYKSFEAMGVTLCDGDARTDELVCLSDLCVNNPHTTTNYYILGADVPSIFVNFSGINGFNLVAADFKINKVIEDRKEFVRLLADFKDGKLEKQYDNNRITFDSVKNIVHLLG
ncbi:MAG: hypothetical protein HYS74_00760 [Parcubacteria group bacterium]|nr:hypothetical protein [Parcubacteria group bacterium]